MITLTIDHARAFEVRCPWTGASGVTDDALLTISRGADGWTANVMPGTNWAGLWLTDTPSEPWDRWRARHGITPSTFATADEALAAALSTEQVTQ